MMPSMSPPPTAIERVARNESLRRPAEWVRNFGGGWVRRTTRPAEQWLGHPAHPPLTDLPIGFWTSAWILDIIGGRRSAPAARRLVGLGVLSAVPTVVTGLGDASGMSESRRRVAALHAICNAGATLVYAWSWMARRHGRRARGVLLGMAGASLATIGGVIGGHLAFGSETDTTGGVDLSPDLSEQLVQGL
jgi:uncharacterized membrane protein